MFNTKTTQARPIALLFPKFFSCCEDFPPRLDRQRRSDLHWFLPDFLRALRVSVSPWWVLLCLRLGCAVVQVASFAIALLCSWGTLMGAQDLASSQNLQPVA